MAKQKQADKDKKTVSKKEEEAQAGIREELDAFVPPSNFKLSNGETIPFPKVSWRKEKMIVEQLTDLFELPEIKELDLDEVKAMDIVRVITSLIRNSPEKIENIVSLIIEKDIDFINDELSSEDIVGVLVPFSMAKMKVIREAWTQTK